VNSLHLYLPSVTEFDSSGIERVTSIGKAMVCALISIEKERKKGMAFPFRESGEEISFIIRVFWPFALLKQPSGKWVIFDSLGISTLILRYGITKSCESFCEEIDKATPSGVDADGFSMLLENHMSTFKDFADYPSYQFNGFLSEKGLRTDLVDYFRFSTNIEPCEALLLTPIISSQKAEEDFHRILELRDSAKRDIGILKNPKSTLKAIIEKWDASIGEEKRHNWDYYNSKIAEIASDVHQKIQKLEEERAQKIAPFEARVDALRNEVSSLEAAKAILESQESDAENELQEARDELEFEENRNSDTERHSARVDMLARKVQRLEEKVSEHNERTEEFSDKVEAAKGALNRKRQERDNIRKPYDQQISQEKARITSLESLRNGNIAVLDEKLDGIHRKSAWIDQSIDRLIRQKESFVVKINELESLLTTPVSRPEGEIYAYVPFLLAKLQSQAGSRFVVFPPSRMRRGKSGTERIKGFLVGTMSVPAEPRSMSTEKLCEILKGLIEANHFAIREVTEKVLQFNLLKSSRFKEDLCGGIEALRNEGWLNEKQARSLEETFSN
jgi:hypothetical protein